MDSKQTLKLHRNIIEQAKIYAKTKNTSLLRLIESYLDLPIDDQEIIPLVQRLSGSVNLPKNVGYKVDYKKHLSTKYSK